ncbi:Mor transcription activator family protein [Algiphilus sp.]|uniref:Mor transcription activator family protein n=1 Tax=Algiphilus sp. TaxID=1872431 RepID=UPI0025BB4D25|nr:Mor transcription activator family protein [Algiphilus sp.]MCK5769484.1 hypothetical protein [Algiphilus sp.]
MSIDQDTEVNVKSRMTRVIREHTGLAERIAVEMAGEAWNALVTQLGGERVYFCPSKAERDAAVIRDFNGRNHAEVCREHDISRRTLYRILNGRAGGADQSH